MSEEDINSTIDRVAAHRSSRADYPNLTDKEYMMQIDGFTEEEADDLIEMLTPRYERDIPME